MIYVPIALFALFLWLAYLDARHIAIAPVVTRMGRAADGALRISAERLARGEIDRADFERICAVLED